MGTRVGRYKVTLAIPHPESKGVVSFSIEDIKRLDHARLIERALLDGGCSTTYVSIRTEDPDQPFKSVGSSDLAPGHVRKEMEGLSAYWRREHAK